MRFCATIIVEFEAAHVTSKLHLNQVKQPAYLIAYLVLLLMSLSGLMFQGGILLDVGVGGFICVYALVFLILMRYIFCYPKKIQ